MINFGTCKDSIGCLVCTAGDRNWIVLGFVCLFNYCMGLRGCVWTPQAHQFFLMSLIVILHLV